VRLLPEAAALVSGSAAELREVLTNLVFNAVDAMPEGGTLTLSSWSGRADVFVAVRDTGGGRGPDALGRPFEPFFTTKGERGNGVGVSVAFGTIQAHGGDINVDSQEGRGTTFTIRLPALRDGSAPSTNTPRPPDGAAAGRGAPAAAAAKGAPPPPGLR